MRKEAITKMQSIIIAAIIVIAAIAGVAVYYSGIFNPAPPAQIKIAKIGWMADFTSIYSSYGIPGRAAAQMAVDHINNDLYPNGLQVGSDRYQFQLVIEDTQEKEEDFPLIVRKLIDDGVFIIMTDLGYPSIPALPDLANAKVPLFVWLDPASVEPLYDPWVFRYRNTSNQTLPAIAYYMANVVNCTKPSTISDLSALGQDMAMQWSTAFGKYGINLVSNQSYPQDATVFDSFITNVMGAGTDVICNNAAIAACRMYLQAQPLGYNGYWASYTGLTEVQAKQIMGNNYASYVQKVYQTEGVDAFTSSSAAVRQWGSQFMNKTGQYPIDLVPWCWDQIMCAVSAGYNAGTFTNGTAFRQALANLPFTFLLSNELKTPMYAQRDNKFFDETKQALMQCMICKWSDEGVKIPVMYAAVNQKGEILATTFPSQDLINTLIAEWHQRNPGA